MNAGPLIDLATVAMAPAVVATGRALWWYAARDAAKPHKCEHGVARCGVALDGQHRCEGCVIDALEWNAW